MAQTLWHGLSQVLAGASVAPISCMHFAADLFLASAYLTACCTCPIEEHYPRMRCPNFSTMFFRASFHPWYPCLCTPLPCGRGSLSTLCLRASPIKLHSAFCCLVALCEGLSFLSISLGTLLPFPCCQEYECFQVNLGPCAILKPCNQFSVPLGWV